MQQSKQLWKMTVKFQGIIPFQEASKYKLTPFEEEIKADTFISKLRQG